MNQQVDLTNCDREPIHVPGSIQPFGFLLALLSDFSICIASENAADYLGFAHSELLHRPLAMSFHETAVQAIRTRVDYLAGTMRSSASSACNCRTAASRSTLPSIFPAPI